MAEDHEGIKFSEYFPHPGLGDQNLSAFRESFPDPLNSYHRKILSQLLGPVLTIPEISFKNHQLWQRGEPVHSLVIKYKLKNEEDLSFLYPLKSKTRVRLDANGLFQNHTFKQFVSSIPQKLFHLIDYIEDPSDALDWSEISLPRARDFVAGSPFEFIVYKPNRSEFSADRKNIIFSGNMGHSLGTLLAYEELITTGNLQEVHGLLTPHIFEEEVNLFKGTFNDGFTPDLAEAKSFLKSLNTMWM